MFLQVDEPVRWIDLYWDGSVAYFTDHHAYWFPSMQELIAWNVVRSYAREKPNG